MVKKIAFMRLRRRGLWGPLGANSMVVSGGDRLWAVTEDQTSESVVEVSRVA